MEEEFEFEELSSEDFDFQEISDEEFETKGSNKVYPDLENLRANFPDTFGGLNDLVYSVLSKKGAGKYDDLLLKAIKTFESNGKTVTYQYIKYLVLSSEANHQGAVDNLFTMYGKEKSKVYMKRFRSFLRRNNIGFKKRCAYYSHRAGRSLSKVISKHSISYLDLSKPYIKPLNTPTLLMPNFIYIL